ncbi:putative Beta-ketoacyl synthase family protein [Leptomonas seymouri]|uniref:beta-ketoacyl-[acyl-carrier-protein] synthase I n=1 Tax=Leptomonas seymouri TaxID=5684 RepID=A0A0N1I5Z2_LEPSE|nr:putative Beta-ketoacyl synthase family protein [Leptomonas seymouri]|eukprot:KPI87344.1 putative Beta-ketoacyl synthase family protein [Leptomonas seymouri]
MGFGALPVRTPRRVVVTGIGMVTPLGLSTADTWAAACRGQSSIRSLLDAPHFLPGFIQHNRTLTPEEKQQALEKLVRAMPCKVAASIAAPSPLSSAGAASNASPDPFSPSAVEPRSFKFCVRAVDEALGDAGLLTSTTTKEGVAVREVQLSDAVRDRVGVNIGMGIPSLADTTDVSQYLVGDDIARPTGRVHYNKVHPLFVPKILGNMAAGNTAIRYKLRGPIGSSVAACATGAHCVGEAAAWIREGRADVMVCGATEACITPVSVAGFSRMRALCTAYSETPACASRPFDTRRAGFVMGEGAGILVLEALEHAVARAAPRLYAELRGFGVSCDAYHVAAPHPDGLGAQHCIQQALLDGGNVPAAAVQYVNAHATGTIGDEVELAAIQNSLRPSKNADGPPLYVSSSKGGLGHLLGAAGSVEAGLAVVALHEQRAPPTANLTSSCLTDAQRGAGIVCVQGDAALALKDCEAVISTSFGFGGINTALLFTRV